MKRKAHPKKRTFMQLYREWERLGSRLKASADRHCIERYGRPMVRHIDRYHAICHANTNCTIHTRVNFRAVAAVQLGEAWHRECLDLTRRWRSWEYHPSGHKATTSRNYHG